MRNGDSVSLRRSRCHSPEFRDTALPPSLYRCLSLSLSLSLCLAHPFVCRTTKHPMYPLGVVCLLRCHHHGWFACHAPAPGCLPPSLPPSLLSPCPPHPSHGMAASVSTPTQSLSHVGLLRTCRKTDRYTHHILWRGGWTIAGRMAR